MMNRMTRLPILGPMSYWNMTSQAQIYRQDQAMAMRLVQEAGYKDPISAFRAHRNKPRK